MATEHSICAVQRASNLHTAFVKPCQLRDKQTCGIRTYHHCHRHAHRLMGLEASHLALQAGSLRGVKRALRPVGAGCAGSDELAAALALSWDWSVPLSLLTSCLWDCLQWRWARAESCRFTN